MATECAVRADSGPSGTSHQYVGGLGHSSDAETGYVYMRARHYDPITGRFASEDSAKDAVNWYVYAAANPVSCIDDDGHFTIGEVGMASGVGAIVSAIGASVVEKLWTGGTSWATFFTFLVIGAVAGALYPIMLGATALAGVSSVAVAVRMAAYIGITIGAGSIAAVVIGAMFHNARMEALIQELDEGLQNWAVHPEAGSLFGF